MVGRYGGLVGLLWGMDMSAEQVGLGRSVRLEMRRTRARARIWRIPLPTGYGGTGKTIEWYMYQTGYHVSTRIYE
jgi:hypothetical protein